MKADLVPLIEAAIESAKALFRSRHPPASLPGWFQTSVGLSTRVVDDARLELKYYFEAKVPLKSNQHWETGPHGPLLVDVDQNTGERRIIITRDAGEFVDLFVVVMDLFSGEITIVTDVDFASIDPEQIEHPVES